MTHPSISLDTSCVLRLLVAQPPQLFRTASVFLAEQHAAGVSIHVSNLVLAEAYFALQAFYQLSKSDAIDAIASFGKAGGVTITTTAREVLALPNLASAKPGFVDRLIHGESHAAGHTFVTFEKAAKKLPATLVIPAS
jgi:predicted nucleic-acid-binding protein